MMKFNVDTRTQFIDRQGVRVQRGEWVPTYFRYVDTPTHEWLIMSEDAVVTFQGQTLVMMERNCSIKGEDRFDKPGTYALIYKQR